MQCRDGGWGAFDADNDSGLVATLPFCDFGEVTDPPSADVTAHVIEMLADEPDVPSAVVDRARRTGCGRSRSPTAPGSAAGASTTSTGPGPPCPALVAAGVDPADDRASAEPSPGSRTTRTTTAAGARTCARTSTPTGAGAGSRPRRRRPGPCSPCWPRVARDRTAVGAAIDWLVRTQTDDGTWDEPWFTGTGFPVGLHHQLPPVPSGLAVHGPRPLRGGRDRLHRRSRSGHGPRVSAGRAALVLRRRRAGHRDGRAGHRSFRRAGLRPPPDRPQPPRRRRPRGAGRRLRARARRGPRRGHRGVLRARRGPGGARGRTGASACAWWTPPVRSWPRSTTRCTASPNGAIRSC